MLEDIIRQIVREEYLVLKQQDLAREVPVPVAAPPVAAPPVAAPPVAAPPVAAPPVAAPPVAAPPVAAPPVAAPPVAAPVAGVPTLDEIRALANDFARAKPQDMHLFAAFMASKGVQLLADMPPNEYPACKTELQRLMGA